MKNVFIAALVGGVILFFWGFLAWAVLPIHNASLREIPNEDAVAAALQQSVSGKGVYVLPYQPQEMEGPAMDAWAEKYRRGPTAMIFFDPGGKDPMMASQLIVGFILCVLSAGVAAWLLTRSTAAAAPFIARVSFVGTLGVLISLASHLQGWNWMDFPTDYATAMVIDTLLAWLLAGAGIAAIIKPPRLADAPLPLSLTPMSLR